MGFYLGGDGSSEPFRARAKSSCFCNLAVTGPLSEGFLLADIPGGRRLARCRHGRDRPVAGFPIRRRFSPPTARGTAVARDSSPGLRWIEVPLRLNSLPSTHLLLSEISMSRLFAIPSVSPLRSHIVTGLVTVLLALLLLPTSAILAADSDRPKKKAGQPK
ncbi:MAG: hypothetical protein CM1200mP2_23190 [Planctomycetaceae bacterium]|nr:MAG: hypothetical protein CM1200mP2_23190 [Planctomycetaceae bacterium]